MAADSVLLLRPAKVAEAEVVAVVPKAAMALPGQPGPVVAPMAERLAPPGLVVTGI